MSKTHELFYHWLGNHTYTLMSPCTYAVKCTWISELNQFQIGCKFVDKAVVVVLVAICDTSLVTFSFNVLCLNNHKYHDNCVHICLLVVIVIITSLMSSSNAFTPVWRSIFIIDIPASFRPLLPFDLVVTKLNRNLTTNDKYLFQALYT